MTFVTPRVSVWLPQLGCVDMIRQIGTCIIGETLDSVSTVFNEIAQHPPHTLFAVCNWSIGHPR